MSHIDVSSATFVLGEATLPKMKVTYEIKTVLADEPLVNAVASSFLALFSQLYIILSPLSRIINLVLALAAPEKFKRTVFRFCFDFNTA